MNTLLQDIRFGLRMLLKSPSISIVATIALALGIGANTAIFSVVNAVLLRPLPFPDPESLVAVFETDHQRGQLRGSHSFPNFFDLRTQNSVFERVSAYHSGDFIMTGRGEPARLQGAVVTADLFPLLGVQPMLGRAFLPDEDKPSEIQPEQEPVEETPKEEQEESVEPSQQFTEEEPQPEGSFGCKILLFVLLFEKILWILEPEPLPESRLPDDDESLTPELKQEKCC